MKCGMEIRVQNLHNQLLLIKSRYTTKPCLAACKLYCTKNNDGEIFRILSKLKLHYILNNGNDIYSTISQQMADSYTSTLTGSYLHNIIALVITDR